MRQKCWNCDKYFTRESKGNGELCEPCYVIRAMRKQPVTQVEYLSDIVSKSLAQYIGQLATPQMRQQIEIQVSNLLKEFSIQDSYKVSVSPDCNSVEITTL